MIAAGTLDRRITIQVATAAQDALGQPVATWVTFAERSASKRDITGRERFAAQQALAAETTIFRIRWLAGVTVKMRILHDDKIYDIEALAELGRREGLDITATAQPLG